MELKIKILEIVKEFADEVPEDTSIDLIGSGVIDSMAIMNILTSVEDEFGIEVAVKDISKKSFKSIDCIAEMINKYLK